MIREGAFHIFPLIICPTHQLYASIVSLQVVVPGEGHFIEPPYAPLGTTSNGKKDDLPADNWEKMAIPYVMYWGGDHAGHEENSVFAWDTILRYLRDTLPSRKQSAKL